MLQPRPRDGAASDAALEGVRKDVLDNVTGPIVKARSHFEATPPDYTKAFIAASQAEGALERIRGGSGRLAPEIQAALATRGPHIATVHLEALEYSGGDMPAGVRSGINLALHDLSSIAGPEAEKRLLGGTAAGASPAPADGAASDAALEGVRKDVLDNVTSPIVKARSHFEATPPDYTKAFIAASQAEGALQRIRGGSGRLAPEIQAALATRGPHIATVHLEALEYSGGDMPAGVRSGINLALHDLSSIAGPEAEKRLLGGTAAAPPSPTEPPKLAPNPYD